MKVIQINNVCGTGSTGKICVSLSKLLTQKSIDNQIIYFRGRSDYQNSKKLLFDGYYKLQALKSKIFGNYGFNSKLATKKLISIIENYKPDIVHIHNIHAHNLHLRLFFNYLKKSGIKVVYTFHDCWAFTGYCVHFSACGCNKWANECKHCVLRRRYSWLFDRSHRNFDKKKMFLENVNMSIVTPSNWLNNLVRKSFLNKKDVFTINNGIDLNIFRPMESNFRKEHKISSNEFMLLGVSSCWSVLKGIDTFISLSSLLPKNYRIVLVGIDKDLKKKLPDNIICVDKTSNQEELAKIYSAADVFVNPTKEDVFPTVNIESIACGTPVITFNYGGSPEIIDNSCGSVLELNDVDSLAAEIIRVCSTKTYTSSACLKRASKYSSSAKFNEYIDLYKRILKVN